MGALEGSWRQPGHQGRSKRGARAAISDRSRTCLASLEGFLCPEVAACAIFHLFAKLSHVRIRGLVRLMLRHFLQSLSRSERSKAMRQAGLGMCVAEATAM